MHGTGWNGQIFYQIAGQHTPLRFRWSGHSPKVERKIGIGRLMEDMLDLFEQHSDEFVRLNPNGQEPVAERAQMREVLRTFGG
jgi:hypothetical protein